MAEILAQGDQYEIEYRMKKKDGSYFWVHDIGRRTVAADGRDAIISVLIDVSQQVHTKARLEYAALSDPLTGISTERVFNPASPKRWQIPAAICFSCWIWTTSSR